MKQATTAQKAEILSRALPYIQRYTGKTVVVKYGGNAMTDDELKAAVMGDIVLLSLVGVKVVLVHGGGPEITALLKKMGKESKFIDGLRYTDEETRDAVQMVLNRTNAEYIAAMFGAEADDWRGKKITMESQMVQCGRDKVPGIRVGGSPELAEKVYARGNKARKIGETWLVPTGAPKPSVEQIAAELGADEA